MREILFRGKRLDNGEWVEGCFGQHTSLDAFIIVRPYPTITGDWSALGFYEVAPTTVGEYTGLQDKNGKRIFEGDIIRTRHGVRRIVFEDGCFGAQRYANDVATLFANLNSYNRELKGDFEIIGNIHDNPELLEGTQ